MKKYIKYIFYRLGITGILDRFIFRLTRIRAYQKNQVFLKDHPGIILPGEYDLFETFQLDYQKHRDEGVLAATEILTEALSLLSGKAHNILDWGCGTGRITRPLRDALPDAAIFGCDSHTGRIDWNRKHSMDITFTTIHPFPPTPYANDFFDVIIGFSVLTHIEAGEQEAWIAELARILKPGGVIWLTTHGDYYEPQLLGFEKRRLHNTGIYTRVGKQSGHRTMTTYHHGNFFQQLLSRHLTLKQHFPGKMYPAKTGGQDVWILQK